MSGETEDLQQLKCILDRHKMESRMRKRGKRTVNFIVSQLTTCLEINKGKLHNRHKSHNCGLKAENQ